MSSLARAGWPLLLLLAAQCHPALEPRPARESGAFAFLASGDTMVVDEYVRTAAELTGTLRLLSREPGGATVLADYRVGYSASGMAEAARLSIRQVSPAGGVSSNVREWNVTFPHGGPAVEVERESGRQTSTSTEAGIAPLFGPSIAMLEAILIQARRTAETHVPVYHLASSGRVDTAVVRLSPDSAHVSVAGGSVGYRLDDSGRIVEGGSDAEGFRTVRLR